MEDPILHGRRKPPNVSVEAAMAEGFQHSTLNCEKKGKMEHPGDVGNEVSLTCAGPGRGEWKRGGHIFKDQTRNPSHQIRQQFKSFSAYRHPVVRW